MPAALNFLYSISFFRSRIFITIGKINLKRFVLSEKGTSKPLTLKVVQCITMRNLYVSQIVRQFFHLNNANRSTYIIHSVIKSQFQNIIRSCVTGCSLINIVVIPCASIIGHIFAILHYWLSTYPFPVLMFLLEKTKHPMSPIVPNYLPLYSERGP
jgi:hypothetical protein